MKKILIVAATAGLITLAACTPTANNTAEENTTVANAEVYTETANGAVDANAVSTNATTTSNMAGNAM